MADRFRLNEYNLIFKPDIKPPRGTGWIQDWHGFYVLEECMPEENLKWYKRRGSLEQYHPEMIETFALFTIIQKISKKKISFAELGSGRAQFSLAAASCVINKIIPNSIDEIDVFAIDGDPYHFLWTLKQLDMQNISNTVLHGAISKQNSFAKFDINWDEAAEWLGQSMMETGSLTVPVYSLDYLFDSGVLEHMDVLHMDIQGAEADAMKGAEKALAEGRIDYIIVGTHGEEVETELKSIMSKTHSLVLELPAMQEAVIDGLKKTVCSAPDGVHVYGRNGLI
jgi:FkbM family methyltransferase